MYLVTVFYIMDVKQRSRHLYVTLDFIRSLLSAQNVITVAEEVTFVCDLIFDFYQFFFFVLVLFLIVRVGLFSKKVRCDSCPLTDGSNLVVSDNEILR